MSNPPSIKSLTFVKLLIVVSSLELWRGLGRHPLNVACVNVHVRVCVCVSVSE